MELSLHFGFTGEIGGFFFFFFFFRILFIFREGKGRRKRGRETSMCGCLSHGDLACNPGMCPGNRTSDPGLQPVLTPRSYSTRAKLRGLIADKKTCYFLSSFFSYQLILVIFRIANQPKRINLRAFGE